MTYETLAWTMYLNDTITLQGGAMSTQVRGNARDYGNLVIKRI